MTSTNKEKSEMGEEVVARKDSSSLQDHEVFLVTSSESNSASELESVMSSSIESSSAESRENEMRSPFLDNDLDATKETKSILNIKDTKSHRQSKHYSSDSSDYESSDSSDDETYFANMRKREEELPIKVPVLKTKGELLIEDLPPVEDLHLSVSPTDLLKIGNILHNIISEERREFLVIVQSDGNSNPLDSDSALFLSSGDPLGKIYDVSGPVSIPIYTVRFNKAEDIFQKDVTKGQDVFYSPKNDELTHFVPVNVLKKQKGSDASWKDNNEPPEEEIDYSDDEQEKLAKQKRRAKTRGKKRDDGEEGDVAPKKMERRDATFNQRVFKRASRNVFHSPMPGPSRSSSGSCSPQRFGFTPPPSDNFGSSGLSRNIISPQQFGPPPPMNSAPFLQRNVSPQAFMHFPRSPQNCTPFPFGNTQSPQPVFEVQRSPQPHIQFQCSPQPWTSLIQPPNSNVPSTQSFGQFPPSNVPSTQSFGQFPPSNVPSTQSFGQFPPSNVPSTQSFGQFPPSNVPSTQSFGQFPPSNVPAPLPFGQLSRSNMPPHQSFAPGSVPSFQASSGPIQQSYLSTGVNQLDRTFPMDAPLINVPLNQQWPLQSHQSCEPRPFSNVPSPRPFRPLLNTNVPLTQSYGQYPPSNVPAPLPSGQLPYSDLPPQQRNVPQDNVPTSFLPLSGLSASIRAPYLAGVPRPNAVLLPQGAYCP